jgi:PfaD family protein
LTACPPGPIQVEPTGTRFFGAGGLSLPKIEQAVEELDRTLGERKPWGVNLIHTPNEPALEEETVDLFIRQSVARVSASAFMTVIASIVRYVATGLRPDGTGGVHRTHHLFAKLSRPELARQFLSPAPESILRELVERKAITAQQAALAATVPVAGGVQ